MRFLVVVWFLILFPLSLFTLLVVAYQHFESSLSPSLVRFSLLTATWAIGLSSAMAIHVFYRRAERAIQQAARDETIVQLAGAVAHELNQPLTVVISSAELLAQRERSLEEMRLVACRMAEAAERMADIVVKLQRATHYRTKPYVGGIKIVDLDKAS